MPQKIIMLKGLPASGKSTWAKEEMKAHPGVYKRINKDLLREMLDDSHWSDSNERFVLRLRDWILLSALGDGKSVIIDDTNFAEKHEKQLRDLTKGYAFEVKFFDKSLQDCIKDDLLRPHPVGESVIREMYNKYLKPEAPKIGYKPGLPDAIICDIDGTLALKGSRSAYDWKKVGEDSVNRPVEDLLFEFDKTKILLVSGRDGVCREETEEWLDRNGIDYYDLWMRPEGNNEDDRIIKERIYREHIEGKFNVKFILDDRDKVVEMWRNLGLTCLQVAPGNF